MALPRPSADVLRPLDTPLTLRESAADRLRTAIISGDIAPGALLRESELALRLGVSATPVREALAALAAEGLVEIETHRLKRATPINAAAMRDLLRVQAALWRVGYQWGLPHIGRATLTEVDAALLAYAAALERNDPLSAIRAGHAFHTAFIAASANSELLRVTLDRRALIARFILLHGRETISQSGLDQHRAILAAYRRADSADVLARLDQLSTRLIALADRLPD